MCSLRVSKDLEGNLLTFSRMLAFQFLSALPPQQDYLLQALLLLLLSRLSCPTLCNPVGCCYFFSLYSPCGRLTNALMRNSSGKSVTLSSGVPPGEPCCLDFSLQASTQLSLYVSSCSCSCSQRGYSDTGYSIIDGSSSHLSTAHISLNLYGNERTQSN